MCFRTYSAILDTPPLHSQVAPSVTQPLQAAWPPDLSGPPTPGLGQLPPKLASSHPSYML